MSHGTNGTAPVTLPLTARLTSRERDAQRQLIIGQLNALTRQVLALTRAVDELRTWRDDVDERLRVSKEHMDGHVRWHTGQAARSFWQRIIWPVTGR